MAHHLKIIVGIGIDPFDWNVKSFCDELRSFVVVLGESKGELDRAAERSVKGRFQVVWAGVFPVVFDGELFNVVIAAKIAKRRVGDEEFPFFNRGEEFADFLVEIQKFIDEGQAVFFKLGTLSGESAGENFQPFALLGARRAWGSSRYAGRGAP